MERKLLIYKCFLPYTCLYLDESIKYVQSSYKNYFHSFTMSDNHIIKEVLIDLLDLFLNLIERRQFNCC